MNGTSLQTLAPAQAAISSPTSRIPSNNSVPSTKPELDIQRKRPRIAPVKYWAKPAIALLVYFFTLYVAVSSPFSRALLGRVSASLGTWLLAALAKAGDIAFAFAVEDTFETLVWRKLEQRRRQSGLERFSGIRLNWFLALVPSTGVEGLVGIFVSGLPRWLTKGVGNDNRGRNDESQQWKERTASRWSALRLAFILLLIPGPGIILMANIDQKNVFFDIQTTEVSGGLATYDPRIATVYHTKWGPEIAKLVQSTLRDRSISWPIDATSAECKATQSCISYLLAGPYQTISPWPFRSERQDVSGFRLYDAPYYQEELWDPEPEMAFDKEKDCELYGGSDGKSENSFLICITRHNSTNALAARWMSCQLGYSSNGTCLAPGFRNGSSGWSTYLRFYRRSATIVFSRTEFTIQEVASLSDPVLQQISPSSLFQSLNAILYRPNQTENDIRYDRKSQQYILTQVIGSNLLFSLTNENLRDFTFGRDWLRNTLTFPVYLFQPTILTTDEFNIPFNESGAIPQSNLPEENSVKGSYCVVDNRSIPGWGTVIGYACVAGLMLIFVGVGKAVASTWPDIDTSGFPVLDLGALTLLVDERSKEVDLKDRFDRLRRHRKENTLDEISDLRIGLRNL